jgi:hypothetical protein
LLNRIENDETYLPDIVVEPELVVRQSTARARTQIRQAGGSTVGVYADEHNQASGRVRS